MTTPLRQFLALLSVGVLLLVSLPVGAVDGDGSPTSDDACCAQDPAEEPVEDSTETGHSSDEGCCPAGCDGCFLKCCSGLLCLSTVPLTLTATQPPQRTVVDVAWNPDSTHPGTVDRPPQL